jgi:hypothetical protein
MYDFPAFYEVPGGDSGSNGNKPQSDPSAIEQRVWASRPERLEISAGVTRLGQASEPHALDWEGSGK